MRRELHVQFREGLGVQLPWATRLVILCRSRAEAEQALAKVKQWVEDNGLTLHPTKTKIVDARTDGFDFLGYSFRGHLCLPRKKSLDKLKETIRAKTRRTNGHSLRMIVRSLNATLHGWFGFFRHCHWTAFTTLDSWIRGRLRSILRKRAGRQGRDHQRWPNLYFVNHGLYSLHAAHGRLFQSLRG
jgi:RNA-directed DNA polymerase